MKKRIHLAIACCAAMLYATSESHAQRIVALTHNNEVFTFDAMNPLNATAPVPVNGLPIGYDLVGMDTRPATGECMLLGYNAGTMTGQLFRLDTASKMLTAIGNGINNFMLSGQVGFDFNPTVDRIRVVSSDQHNYRLHPVTGALAATDGTLAYNNADVNAGTQPSIGSGAYTNSYIASTSTTLYNIDDSLKVLTIQNPPNNGVQNTIASIGLSLNPMDATTDLDIYTDPVSGTNTAFLVANTGTSMIDSLYKLDLATGNTMLVGNLNQSVKDIAIAINRSMPAVSGQKFYALSANGNLLTFYASHPEYVVRALPVTGITVGHTLVGMDVRAADLKLYGLSYNAASMTARVYTIDPMTAVATPVSMDSITNINLSGLVGVDFNPVADRLRVVTSMNRNYRINQLTGLLAATDSILMFKMDGPFSGVDPTIASAAYSNSKRGATATTMFVYDDSLNVLLTQDPPNLGLLNNIGMSGVMVNTMDRTSDLDIYYNHNSDMNEAFMMANTTNTHDMLYRLNTETGAVTPMGRIGLGIALLDFAVQLDTAQTMPTGLLDAIQGKGNYARVYPNPASNEVTIQTHFQEEQVRISVVDITGKVILEEVLFTDMSGNTRLDITHLTSGMYWLNVHGQTHSVSAKLIK